ncbi:c-type cytochrome domain-containing protein [Parapedobacter tibetensis]|uniref:c-type cytochrome domain-containing protein n=1 Tax=Parapedobacter tibetensis TaxID=2972951 RepID=UPI00214D2AC8|nr:c-type cytochrome domain-containing protein [Parapedobacter tibetensis]
MKSIQSLLLNLLIGLNVFILFFLLFESRIVVPVAFQLVGRMHPLLLHFPIVLLVLAWLLACFGNRLNLQQAITWRFVHAMLFASAWSAAITVVAGLLLSKEGGYEGNGFLWHKWMGVALCFMVTALLWYHWQMRNKESKYDRTFLAGLNLSLVALILVGHFGASLTHGEDYLLEPLRRNEQKTLNVETAVVFPDLVYPILQAKCLGCHSKNKAKGGLILADTSAVLKGGENGPLLVKGSAEESLIIQRLLLDLDHEHRMPPKGKPQLTPEELALIKAWVISGADFNRPLSAMPLDDTLYHLAEAVYGPAAKESYDFPAADAKTIAALNTPYRTVKPLSHASPALAVGFYGKAFYTKQSLQELSPINRQIVSLTLSGMPLSAEDRETLASFVNLRELILNNTPVDDTWGELLGQLLKLHKISLSSTSITETGLTRLLSAPDLRTVYVWNTGIGADVLERLQQEHQEVRIERGYVDDGNVVLPLNEPLITPASGFFRDEVQIALSHPIPGVELRYTVDGSEPDSLHSMVYDTPYRVKSAVDIKVKAYKTGWLSSSKVVRSFHRSGYTPHQVSLMDRPHPQYRGRETLTLFDLESGGSNHADGKWLGFHGQRMGTSMYFDTDIRIDTVGVSVKQDYRSHIYPPKTIEIWGGADSVSARLLGRFHPELLKQDQVLPRRMIHAAFDGKTVSYLRVTAEPFGSIPDGYPGGGHPSWIFVDEIIIH